MAFTFNGSTRLTGVGVEVGNSRTLTGTGATTVQEIVPDGSTDLAITALVDEDALIAMSISSTQDVTVKTNSSGTPQETIQLKANSPLFFMAADADHPQIGEKPISDDLTAMYVTNSSGTAATLTLLALTDATP